MNEILNTALGAILQIVLIAGITLLAKYGMPWVGRLIKAFIIDRLVAAAEQKIKGSGLGAEKKAYVLDRLAELKIKVTGFVDDLIEASVYKLNEGKEKIEQRPIDFAD